MNTIIKRSIPAILSFSLLLFLHGIMRGQTVSINYYYSFAPSIATEPPQLGGLEVAFPVAARKNGVEGTVKATATLGEDGKVRDIAITQDLPFGVGEAVKVALQRFYFKPAETNGKPLAITMKLDYVVTILYAETDKNVTKPQITEKPSAEYPASQRAEKIKGKVTVSVMFFADGTLKVLGVSSVMPKEFDKAALEAAKKIKFTPAVHKKSKKPVAQQVMIEYEFKP